VRRMLLGGVIGGLPGMLLVTVPLALHELDVITSDQSQIGFLGVPLLFLGIPMGLLLSSPGRPQTGRVMRGVVVGGILGIAAAVILGAALSSAGVALPLLWLILGPAGMIAGGVIEAQHDAGSRQPAPHH
jgi:hypothetical protein